MVEIGRLSRDFGDSLFFASGFLYNEDNESKREERE